MGAIFHLARFDEKRSVLPRIHRATRGRAIVRDHGCMATVSDELAGCLRSWRQRVSPVDVGISGAGQRRVPGLRREEVAQLAGVSMDYLTRLEQGRATSPSTSVLSSLARALRLSDIERDHLFQLAGQPLPAPGVIDTRIPASVIRLMDRLEDVPVLVTTVV